MTTGVSRSDWQRGLYERKTRLISGEEEYVVAVGNSAADMDSIVSAMAVAHLMRGVAMAAIRADEFALRSDVVAFLKFCDCVTFDERHGAATELVYADDAFATSAVALTDHNKLDKRLFSKLPEVRAVFDHHVDEGQHSEVTMRVVDPGAGSACTLVAERMLEVSGDELPRSLMAAMLGAIVLDTRGFSPKKNKYSQRDILAAHNIIDALSGSTENNGDQVTIDALRSRSIPALVAFRGAKTVVDLADALADARHDVGHLSASQLLRMDYKQATIPPMNNIIFGDIGVAGVLVDLPTLIERLEAEENLASVLDHLGKEKPGLAIVFAMTSADKSSKPRRKAILYRIIDHTLLPIGFSSEKFEFALTSLGGGGPKTLPPHLADNPLYQTQGILDHGFRLEFSQHPEYTNLRFSYLPKVITRKTMLPALLHVLQPSTFGSQQAAPEQQQSSPSAASDKGCTLS